ncbi:hypothetical protein [Haloarcula onubensis]|uniref:Uncharacterized protein n=1 Tax=Haloarcula onubensis TaxID=2950539 RepID=A0ABU2FMN6_9EURY|nr:hypothetical protein [Halomicroarcula sp. S3CR25-11]MDS0281451.1 hypothetical protein [Halomicroarcula sp. S3CR25-11]
MGRRNFLRVAISAVAAGLAGCGALGDDRPDEATFEPSGADHLATAVGQLNKAALAVDEFRDREEAAAAGDGSPPAFDASGPRARIRTAREAVTAAGESDADGADVAAVGRYADGVEGTVDAVAEVTAARDLLETARSGLDSGGDDVDIDAASATLEAATTASGAAQTACDGATVALAGADGDRLTALDAAYDAVRSGVEALLEVIVGVDGLAVGYDTYLDGVAALRTGESRVDAEAFDAARASFSDAESAFTDAGATFTDAEGRAAADLRSELTDGDERSRALSRLAAGYVSLVDSRDHLRAAESAIERDERDAAREALGAGSADATTASDRFDAGAAVRAEFADEFRTARDRATVMESLSDGYARLLDAWDHLATAESALDDGTGTAQSSLDDASADATAADETFAAGAGSAPDLFGDELAEARSRAGALDALAGGYGHVLDGRALLGAGERAFTDERYDRAASAFADAAVAAGRAETAFAAGDPAGDDDLFGSEFDRASRRASVLRSLGEGYELVVAGRQAAAAGRRDMTSGEFAAARVRFRFADGRFEDAETVFEDGRADAGAQFGAEVDRALCRVGHLRDAMAHLVAAAEAGAVGDRRTLLAEAAAEGDRDRASGC